MIEETEYGEREWVSADAMDRQVKRADTAEAERDKLVAGLEAEIKRYREVAEDLTEHDRHARMVGLTFVADRLQTLLNECKGGDDGDE